MNQQLLEEMIKDVITSMSEQKTETVKTFKPEAPKTATNVSAADYPLGANKPELLKTPSGKSLDEITLESVVSGDVKSNDVRITAETLELQAQVAESAGRKPIARNFRRAAELTIIPDERILDIYNALRPYRSTKEELLAIADELETKYNATINAAFVREAVEVYEQRNVLKAE